MFMDHNLKCMFWNVRGLNCSAKCTAIHSVITSDLPSIVCHQETKLDYISLQLMTETLGPSFDGFYFLPAEGTRGGILLAWRSSVIYVSSPTIGDHRVMAAVSSLSGDRH